MGGQHTVSVARANEKSQTPAYPHSQQRRLAAIRTATGACAPRHKPGDQITCCELKVSPFSLRQGSLALPPRGAARRDQLANRRLCGRVRQRWGHMAPTPRVRASEPRAGDRPGLWLRRTCFNSDRCPSRGGTAIRDFGLHERDLPSTEEPWHCCPYHWVKADVPRGSQATRSRHRAAGAARLHLRAHDRMRDARPQLLGQHCHA